MGFIKNFPLLRMFLSIVFWQQSKNRIIYGARFISALFFPAVPLQSCPEKSQIWGHGDRLLCCLVLLPSSMVPSEMTEITRFIQVFSSHLPAWQCCLTWLANCKLLAAWETVSLTSSGCSVLNLSFYCVASSLGYVISSQLFAFVCAQLPLFLYHLQVHWKAHVPTGI